MSTDDEDKTDKEIIEEYFEAVNIIVPALKEMAPHLTDVELDHNARAIIARLSQRNFLLIKNP